MMTKPLPDVTATPDQLPGALRDLKSTRPEMRARAARILGNLGGPEPIAALIDALGDPDPTTGAAVQNSLLLLRPHSNEAIVGALQHADGGVRAGAVQLVGTMHHVESLETAHELLHDPSPDVRIALTQTLVKLEGRKAFDSLANLLADTDGSVRRAAAEAVGAISDGSGAGLLIPRLQDYDPAVRLATIEILGRVGDGSCVDALRALQDDPDAKIANATRDALTAIGDRAVGPFIADLTKKEIAVRLAAFDALVKKGKAAVMPLLAEVEHRNPAIRIMVIELLGAIGDDLALPVFIRALKDRNKRIRGAAIAALGRTRSLATVQSLGEMLEDEDSGLADIAAAALIGIGQPAAPRLCELLHAERPDVRERAARVLGEIRDEGTFDALAGALRDSAPWVRAAAATSLGNLLLPMAVDPLLDLLGDSHPAVRAAAADAVGHLRDVRATAELLTLLEDVQESVRAAATRALGHVSDRRSVEPLLGLLEDSSSDVRAASAEALGNMQVAAALDRLRKMARPLGLEHWKVKRAARRAIREILKAREEQTELMKAHVENKSTKVTYR
jgi:HEAT repeat protein